MPIPNTQLASILSARITALGAVPVTSDLQADDAENLLWNQLLTLITNDASEVSNLLVWRTSSTIVNSADVETFPNVGSAILTDLNFPTGSVVTLKLSAEFNNDSGGPVDFAIGARLSGGADQFPNVISVPDGEAVELVSSTSFLRTNVGIVQIIETGWYGFDGTNDLVRYVTGRSVTEAFAAGQSIEAIAQMSVASADADVVLFSAETFVKNYQSLG